MIYEARAATIRTWTGLSVTSGNWTTAANWQNNQPPVAGDVLSFPDTGLRRTSNTNNFPAGTAFSTINLFDTGYRLRGNSVTISNYISAGLNSGTNTVDLDLAAAGPGVGITLRSFSSSDLLILNGDINLNNRTLTTEGPADFRIVGVISGTGGIFKNNSGELSLAGLGANTYSGLTLVSSGILRLGRYILRGLAQVGTVAVPGDLTIGSGTGGLIGDIVVLDRDNQIANTSDVIVNGSGSLELSDESDTIGSLRLTGGTVLTGAGILGLNGNVQVNLGTKDSLISGGLDLGTNTFCRFDVVQGAELNIPAQISGDIGTTLIKTNRGELSLSGSNIFNGPVQMDGGTINVLHGAALGTTSGNARLRVGAINVRDVGVFGEELDVQGPAGVLEMDGGSAAWNGSVILNDDLTVNVPTNRTLSITGKISGPAGFNKINDGGLQLKTTYTNTYAGTGWVRDGFLTLDGVFHQVVVSGPLIIGETNDPPGSERVHYIKHHQIGAVPITIHPSGILQPGSFDDVVGSITGAGEIEIAGGSLSVGGDGGSATFSGEISGTGDLQKVGAGIWTLQGSKTWAGLTTVSAGGLVVNGSQPASPVLVGSGAFLGGTGIVGRLTNSAGGLVAPSGFLTCSNVVLNIGSTLNIDLKAIGHDQLNARGTVNLTGALLTGSCGFTPALGQSFTIINNDGADAVTGTFQGLPQGAVFGLGGFAFRINYQGGTGNDVALVRVQAPASNLSSWSVLPNGQFKFGGTGLPNVAYVIQAANNLNPVIPWVPIATNIASPAGLYEFIDTDAAAYPMRFYRAVAP